ncbi:MAG: TPD domain-containing protein [Thermoplasmata archaeon]|nr:TPD domain-containing protein [Thermoplasmata archaeon]
MKLEEFKWLFNNLRNPGDIKRLARRGYDRELLLVIYNQKIVRTSTRMFYEVKNRSKSLLRRWKRGKSFIDIAREERFPPVLVANLILKENNVPRKKYWKYLCNPQEIKDRRLREELGRVAKYDIVYSPKAMEDNYARGKLGEKKINNWLQDREIPFETENDIKGKYPKTPDFLLGKPIKFNGSKRYWIESKASFGSAEEIRKNVRSQLKPYKELFGDGIVIYWFGYIDDLSHKIPQGVLLADKRFFRDFDRNA